jgi:hypothetical protein
VLSPFAFSGVVFDCFLVVKKQPKNNQKQGVTSQFSIEGEDRRKI